MIGASGLTITGDRMSELSDRTGEQEMLAKLYMYTWAVIAALFVLFTVTGTMTMLNNLVAFGFIAFGMVFMGMIAVLPSMVSHPTEAPKPKALIASPKPFTAAIQHGAHSVRA